MKILELEYHDKILDWKLKTSEFSDLNLLVGISGVGKTKILQAILNLKGMALGKSISGLEWKIKFEIDKGNIYEWEGETEKLQIQKGNSFFGRITRNQNSKELIKQLPRIIKEKLMIGDESVIDRDESKILYQQKEIPKLSLHQSIINLLNEDKIKKAYEGFSKIIFRDISKNLVELSNLIPKSINSKDKIYKSLINIKNSDINFILKLLLVEKNKLYIFKTIKNKLKEIFPQVEDLVIREEPTGNGINIVNLYIKEKGIKTLIHQGNISSGMMRTIEHLCDIYLSPDNAVILIDEFETSLGVNCINFITDGILSKENKNQYIITSHHPYIINNISKDYWKLVSRKGNTVSTHSAKDLNLPDSNHQAFIQLINSEEYTDGIKSL